MTEDAYILDDEQRQRVKQTVADHCAIRGWILHAVNCRTNHLHIVVTADLHPKKVRSQFKAWCTRRLKELEELEAKRRSATNPKRQRGSKNHLHAVIRAIDFQRKISHVPASRKC